MLMPPVFTNTDLVQLATLNKRIQGIQLSISRVTTVNMGVCLCTGPNSQVAVQGTVVTVLPVFTNAIIGSPS